MMLFFGFKEKDQDWVQTRRMMGFVRLHEVNTGNAGDAAEPYQRCGP